MNEIKIKRAAQDYLYRLIRIGVNMGRACNLHYEMIGIIECEKLTQKETALLIDILVGQESFSLKQDKAPDIEVDLEELRKKWAEAPDINYESVKDSSPKTNLEIGIDLASGEDKTATKYSWIDKEGKTQSSNNIPMIEDIQERDGMYIQHIDRTEIDYDFLKPDKPKIEEMEREIIGYKFKDAGAYGTFFNIYYQATNKIYPYQYNLEGRINGYDIDNLDCNIYLFFCKEHEILEIIFNPIYKEEFKVGDIVVGWHNNENKLNSNAWEIGKISEKGKISKNEYVYPDNEVSWNTGISNIRKATPEEIEEFNKKENDLKAGHWYKTDKEKSLWFIK